MTPTTKPNRRTQRGFKGATRIVAAVLVIASVAACSSGDDPSASSPDVSFSTQPSVGATGPSTTIDPTATIEPAVTDSSLAVDDTSPSSSAEGDQPPAVLGDPSVGLASIGEFDQPVDLAWRRGDPTMFVVERPGRIIAIRDGQAGSAVLDMTELTEAEGERGLLGLTFSVDGAYAFVNHTNNDGNTVIAEYAVDATGMFNPASRRVLLNVDQPYANHNGGDVTIGPDAMLYIGMGDGGSAGDPERHALNVTSLLGKILRIDPTPSLTTPYSIPADNPFIDVAGARPEIWAVGVRNPWRMSFDSATGDFWIADVGQDLWEEIDVAWAADGGGRGFNFGWSAWEGAHRFNDDQSPDGVTQPIFEYGHGDAGCSVSGGAVYRGTTIPELAGWYVFGDYCSGAITALQIEGREVARSLLLRYQPTGSALREGPDNELYALSLDGDVSMLVPA